MVDWNSGMEWWNGIVECVLTYKCGLKVPAVKARPTVKTCRTTSETFHPVEHLHYSIPPFQSTIPVQTIQNYWQLHCCSVNIQLCFWRSVSSQIIPLHYLDHRTANNIAITILQNHTTALHVVFFSVVTLSSNSVYCRVDSVFLIVSN
jgi:hypothetical protein